MGWLGRMRAVLAADIDAPAVPSAGVQFAIGTSDVDPALFGLTSYTTSITPDPPISRAEAIQVPAVKRARDLIAGTLGRLPLYTMSTADFTRSSRPLIDQPERDVPRAITMTHTVEDLLFYSVAWWRITERDFVGRATHVRRLEPTTVGINPEGRAYIRRDGASQGSALEWPEDRDLIRFDSPNDGLLDAGARAIRRCARLGAAAAHRAEDPIPAGYFTTEDGAEPMWAGPILEGESEAEFAAREAAAKVAFLENWAEARRARSTAFIPAGLVYNVVQNTAPETQLAEALQNAVLEVARVAGVDADYLNANPPGDSNTYNNAQDRRNGLTDFTLAAYMAGIQDRLSMEDVTPRGTVVRFDVTGFRAGDEKTRMETYVLAAQAGAYGPQEVRRREELPDTPDAAPTAAVRPLRAVPDANGAEPVAASVSWTGLQLDAGNGDGLTFGFAPGTVTVDRERRTITGLAVLWDVTVRHPGTGRSYRFPRGSLVLPEQVSRVKLLVQHDMSHAVGRAIALEDRTDGLWPTFKVARGPEGDRALSMAEDGVWDGLSIGAPRATEANFRPDAAGVLHAVDVPLDEISLTPIPVFTEARVSAVAASIGAPSNDSRGPAMSGDETGNENTQPATEPAPTTTPATDPAPAPVTLDAGQAAQFAAFQAWQAAQGAPASPEPAPQPETFHVPAIGRPVLSVTEASPYAFDVSRGGFLSEGQFDLSGDLRLSAAGSYEAQKRVLGFLGEALELANGIRFDIDMADGATLNPSRQRPDLYVGQKLYDHPLWAAVNKESLKDKTPFILPKRNTSTINVAVHTEGVEPTGASATWTSQTVTPDAVSGKVEITRELWDQGGNPKVSNLIWGEMVARWYDALEARVVTVLTAAAASITDIALTAGTGAASAGPVLSGELASAFASLQFERGGDGVMDVMATQVDLYKAIVNAKDNDGRHLFPILGPMNANGQAVPRFRTVNVHGVTAIPSWALAATGSVVANSWLFDRKDVYGAASTPDRLEFQYRVAYVDLAIWGYAAAAITDTTGVRQITYDPVA